MKPRAESAPECEPLFLSASGDALDPDRLTDRVGELVDAAPRGKRGSRHLFRHTCATLMLENGADGRFIRRQLGHSELFSAQICTHVSVRMPKEIDTRPPPSRPLNAR